MTHHFVHVSAALGSSASCQCHPNFPIHCLCFLALSDEWFSTNAQLKGLHCLRRSINFATITEHSAQEIHCYNELNDKSHMLNFWPQEVVNVVTAFPAAFPKILGQFATAHQSAPSCHSLRMH